MLLALVDRKHAIWLALAAGFTLLTVGLLELEIKPKSRWFRFLDGVGVFAFGCLTIIVARMITEIVLQAMRLSNNPGGAIWLASVILIGGWVLFIVKRHWLFAFGVIEIAWGLIVGLNSQAIIKDPHRGLQLISIVTGVFLVSRGLSDCTDANLAFSKKTDHLLPTVAPYRLKEEIKQDEELRRT